MKAFKIAGWLILVLAIIGVVSGLISGNSDEVSVRFFNWETEVLPKWIVVVVSFIIGAIFTSLFFIIELVTTEAKNIRLRRLNQKLERALAKVTNEQNLRPEGGTKEIEISGPSPSDDKDDV